MRARRRALAGGAAALLVAAACFSERAPITGAEEGLCEGTAPAGVVRIRDFTFQPAELRVGAGTEVTWVNCDPDTHSATSDAYAWDSGLLSSTRTFRRTFDTAGTFAYHCEPHPFMRGTVVVE